MTSLGEFRPAFMSLELRGPVVVAHISRQTLSEEENIDQMGQEFTMLIEQFGLFVKAEYDKWAKVIKAVDAQVN